MSIEIPYNAASVYDAAMALYLLMSAHYFKLSRAWRQRGVVPFVSRYTFQLLHADSYLECLVEHLPYTGGFKFGGF